METILIIESNSNILENLSEGFEMEGYKVLAANTGNKGIELARKFLPDIIVSGILIGKMDGYEVLSSLLGTPKTTNIPFIFSTTKCEKSDMILGLWLGADDYIVKPYGLQLLFNMAKKWIKSGTHRCYAN